MNQAAVRAALKGRVLILEGVEKAERNVLPLLNNLLENREMGLEEGSFLTSTERYDALASKLEPAQLLGSGNVTSTRWQSGTGAYHHTTLAVGLPLPLCQLSSITAGANRGRCEEYCQ